MQDQTETTQTFTPKTPDLKHRFDDCPSNSIGCASSQIKTVLNLLYPLLEPSKPKEITIEMVNDLHKNQEQFKQEILDILFIIDSLNSDIAAIAQTID